MVKPRFKEEFSLSNAFSLRLSLSRYRKSLIYHVFLDNKIISFILYTLFGDAMNNLIQIRGRATRGIIVGGEDRREMPCKSNVPRRNS